MRRFALAALVFPLFASCAVDVPQTTPQATVYALFKPPSAMPLPNDILLQIAAPADASDQTKLFLNYLQNTLKGFPVNNAPATTSFGTLPPSGQPAPVAGATLDETTLTDGTKTASDSANIVVLDSGSPLDVEHAYDPATGVIKIWRKGKVAWQAGHHYLVGLRAGPHGIKDKAGNQVQEDTAFYLLTQDKALVDGMKHSTVGGLDDATAGQLEQLRQSYAGLVFNIFDNFIPHKELAVIWTFQISGNPESGLDPATGVIPFPNDLVRAKDASGNYHVNLPINATDSDATKALKGGLNTLDGFSTTAPITASTLGSIDANTVSKQSVLLFEVTATGATPVADYAALVPDKDSTSNTIAIVPTKPLKDATTYAAIVTTAITNQSGALNLAPSPAQALLLATVPLADSAGKSLVPTVDDAIAAGAEQIRLALKPLVDGFVAAGIPREKIALLWTFTTVSIRQPAAQLRALPFGDGTAAHPKLPTTLCLVTPTGPDCPTDAASWATALSATAVTGPAIAAANGYDPTVTRLNNVKEMHVFAFGTASLLSPTTGAFDPSKAHREDVLVTLYTPRSPNNGAHGAQVVLFHHGLKGSRNAAVALANHVNGTGLALVAIDSALDGDRTYCDPTVTSTHGADDDCTGGAKCQTVSMASGALGKCLQPSTCDPAKPFWPDSPAAAGQTDATCIAGLDGAFLKRRQVTYGGSAHDAALGEPVSSGTGFVGPNLFLIRDTIRQDFIDYSQLINVLEANAAVLGLDLRPMDADGHEVFYAGQSEGAIRGAMLGAAEARIGNMLLNVGGAGFIDVFTTSPGFVSDLNAVLTAVGADQATHPAAYAQFVATARWVLDAADPQNFAAPLTDATRALPDLVASAVKGSAVAVPAHDPTQPIGNPNAKTNAVFTQLDFGDQTVPVPTQIRYSALLGIAPASTTCPASSCYFDPNAAASGNRPPTDFDPTKTNPHAFITHWSPPTGASPDVATYFHQMTSEAQGDLTCALDPNDC